MLFRSWTGTGLVREYARPEELVIQEGGKQIAVFDSETDEDLHAVTDYLHGKGRLRVLAGCAGFAAAMAKYLQISCAEKKAEKLEKPFLIVCGSINDISKRQVSHAKEKGVKGITLTLEQLLEKDYLKTGEGRKLVEEVTSTCGREGAGGNSVNSGK